MHPIAQDPVGVIRFTCIRLGNLAILTTAFASEPMTVAILPHSTMPHVSLHRRRSSFLGRTYDFARNFMYDWLPASAGNMISSTSQMLWWLARRQDFADHSPVSYAIHHHHHHHHMIRRPQSLNCPVPHVRSNPPSCSCCTTLREFCPPQNDLVMAWSEYATTMSSSVSAAVTSAR